MTEDGKILSEAREMYKNPEKGIIPNECAEFLKKIKDRVVCDAIENSGMLLESFQKNTDFQLLELII